MIPDDVVSEIRERADIVAMVGEHVQLKKVGINHKGLCPFHQEKTPSFHVNAARRSFYCFGCNKKGDVFSFLMELQGKGFAETVREVAERVGVVIPERPVSPEEQARRSERGRLHDLNAVAAAFFRATLGDARLGAAGRAYLARRGIGDEAAATFQLGFAPDAWDGLTRHLEGRRVAPEPALQLGLVAARQNRNGFYDRFRNRVMCPVILPGGEIAGFSGRTLSEEPDTPKYLNSPESPVYKKSHLLFGLHAARAAFARKGRAVLVEGNFDVIALHHAGFAETVAPLGTALTGDQIEILRRLASRVILCLDGDKAGRAAGLRAIPVLVAAGIDARIVVLPEGEDPDSFVRKMGAPAFEELLGRAQPVTDYFVEEAWYRSDRSADAQAAALRQAAPMLSSIGDEVKREIVTGQLALAMGVAPHVVRQAMRGVTPAPAPARPPEDPADRRAPPPALEIKLFAILEQQPALLDEAEGLGIGSLLTDERLRDMYSRRLPGQSFLDAAPKDFSQIVAPRLLSGEFTRLDNPRRVLHETVNMLKSERLEHELAAIARRIKDAARRGDSTLARELSIRQIETRKAAEDLKRRPEPGRGEESR
jgi:DNA primase